ELAQVFARFGSAVTIVEALPRVLALEEPEASGLITPLLERDGITVRTGVAAAGVAGVGGGVAVTLADGSTVSGERLLVATGRRCDLRKIDAARAGIDETARWIQVDGTLRAAPGVW